MTGVNMSSAAFPCPALSARDQADKTKYDTTTKDYDFITMRETSAHLPCKNENYTAATSMQSIGST
ncbi:hypothetical protein IG631_07696 [Alternaria alternata]|nr:hypothetical protein IG631_07696 [Alternaria alternata]